MKLSKQQIQRYSVLLQHFGDDLGISPKMSINAPLLWSDYVILTDERKNTIIPYTIFFDDEYYYYCLLTSVFQVKRIILHHAQLSYKDFAIIFYLVFINHNTIEL